MPSHASADTTTADFLQWNRSAQDSYFQISIAIAGIIAAQTQPEIAECIENWYYESPERQAQRHSEIIAVMPQYTEFDPAFVLLGYLEGACGQFDRAN